MTLHLGVGRSGCRFLAKRVSTHVADLNILMRSLNFLHVNW